MLSQSVKSVDSLKVGQFGIGFKSVFHLTGNKFILHGNSFCNHTVDAFSVTGNND